MEDVPIDKRIPREEDRGFSLIAWIINALAVGLVIGTALALIGFYLLANSGKNLGALDAVIAAPVLFFMGLIMGFIGFSIHVWKTRVAGPMSIGLAVIAILVIAFYVMNLRSLEKVKRIEELGKHANEGQPTSSHNPPSQP